MIHDLMPFLYLTYKSPLFSVSHQIIHHVISSQSCTRNLSLSTKACWTSPTLHNLLAKIFAISLYMLPIKLMGLNTQIFVAATPFGITKKLEFKLDKSAVFMESLKIKMIFSFIDTMLDKTQVETICLWCSVPIATSQSA